MGSGGGGSAARFWAPAARSESRGLAPGQVRQRVAGCQKPRAAMGPAAGGERRESLRQAQRCGRRAKRRRGGADPGHRVGLRTGRAGQGCAGRVAPRSRTHPGPAGRLGGAGRGLAAGRSPLGSVPTPPPLVRRLLRALLRRLLSGRAAPEPIGCRGGGGARRGRGFWRRAQ